MVLRDFLSRFSLDQRDYTSETQNVCLKTQRRKRITGFPGPAILFFFFKLKLYVFLFVHFGPGIVSLEFEAGKNVL